ncbi:hypothetical protein PRIC1_010489 [Phytophthora ramorum]
MCRVHAVANTETGELTEELQCTDTNSSLVEASQDSSVFWTYAANVRNNNATFPVGANCYSLMLRDGTVDSELQDACTSASTTTEPRFTTYTEAPLVVIYLLYLAFFVVLGGWAVYKNYMQNKNQSVNEMNKKLIATPQTPSRAVAGNPQGRHTSVRASDTRMQIEASEGILQTGFSNSFLGTFVFGCVVVASLALNALLIVIIADYYGRFDPPLFDASEDNAVVFIVVWVITSIWFVTIVALQDRIYNFFRLRVTLDKCESRDFSRPREN